MYRAALRSASRPAVQSLRSTAARTAPRRFASTASPADKPRSWKSSLARWGIAIAGVYYYNVSSTLADDFSSSLNPTPDNEGELHTVESMVEQRRKEISTRKQAEKSVKKVEEEKLDEKPLKAETEIATETPKEPEAQEQGAQSAIAPVASPGAPLEDEASQDGAFNPETGEINWDCPCLGGMAHGPCGEQFKSAFSCFVYSTEEPKGMDCIEKFQGMQECFRQYPEIYGSELQDDEDAELDAAAVATAAPGSDEVAPASKVAAEPVQSLEPVVEPAKVTEPPVAEFQTLREGPSGTESSRKLQSEQPAVDQKAKSATPWTDTTAANEIVEEKK